MKAERALALPIERTALVVIDVQAGFDHQAWGPRNNPDAEVNVAALLGAWRGAGGRVAHVLHDSPAPDGLLCRGGPGHSPKREAEPHSGEPVYVKRVNSAFIGTTLEEDLRKADVTTLVLVGLTTNHCISTTARMSANLGFATFVVSDATAAFARTQIDGRTRAADDVHLAALSDLQDEFATIIDTRAVLAALASRKATHVPVQV